MIISARADIECDRCKVVATIIASNLTGIRKRARQQGWGSDPSGCKDWCVNCVARHTASAAQRGEGEKP